MYTQSESNLKLSVITNPYDLKYETKRANQMFSEGLDELHIRKPKRDDASIKKFIEQIDEQYHNKLVLHSHYSLVNQFDINKIHLPHNRISNFASDFYLDKIVLKGKKVRKSTTINNCDVLFKPVSGIDQYILGPVFVTISNITRDQRIETDILQKALRHSKVAVSALGGVSSQTLEFFKNVGFKGITIQSAVWKSPDPVAALIELRDHYLATERRLRIAV